MSKNYIGSGKRNEKFNNIISVTICINDAEKFVFEYNGKKYLKFDVAEKKEPDQYGKTHSVSIWTKDAEPNKTSSDDRIPF